MQSCKLLSSRSGIQVLKQTHYGQIIPEREKPPPKSCSRSGALGFFFSFKVRGMNTPQKPENDIHYADTQHPVEHIEPLPQDVDDSIERICQVLGRTFEWVAEADEPSEKGLRAAVVLYCVRSDLIGRESLEDLAFSLHYTESEVENLVTNFCHAINWR